MEFSKETLKGQSVLLDSLTKYMVEQGMKYGYSIIHPNDTEQVPDILSYIEEDCTPEELEWIEKFLMWVFSDYDARKFGSATYATRVFQFAYWLELNKAKEA